MLIRRPARLFATGRAAGRSNEATNLRPKRKSAANRRQRVLMATLAVAIVFLVVTARLFVWPATGMPSRVSAIVMLAGPGNRLGKAVRLAREHRADFFVVSRGHDGYGGPCPPPVPGVRLICFDPNPATTQGEAEYVAKLAKRYRWRSITLVTTTPQDSRARVRMERCFGGRVYVVDLLPRGPAVRA